MKQLEHLVFASAAKQSRVSPQYPRLLRRVLLAETGTYVPVFASLRSEVEQMKQSRVSLQYTLDCFASLEETDGGSVSSLCEHGEAIQEVALLAETMSVTTTDPLNLAREDSRAL